jgi:hypothetical protein
VNKEGSYLGRVMRPGLLLLLSLPPCLDLLSPNLEGSLRDGCGELLLGVVTEGLDLPGVLSRGS